MTDSMIPKDPPCPLVEASRHFGDAEAFVAFLLMHGGDPPSPEFRSPWVYRGHFDAGWELQPSAWRPEGLNTLQPLKRWLKPHVEKAIAADAGDWSDERRSIALERALQCAAEVCAVSHFCALADDIGMQIPEAGRLLSYREVIYESLFHRNPLEDVADLLFVDQPFAFAQHHGIPTRYLDWTLDPLIAAFFASQGNEQDANAISPHLCVYAMRRDGPAAKRLHWVKVPRSGHHYLHAQHGLFSYQRDANDRFDRSGRWPTLREAFVDLPPLFNRVEASYDSQRPRDVTEWWKFTLPRSEAVSLRRLLFGRRISSAQLMPTLDHVARTARQRWDWYER